MAMRKIPGGIFLAATLVQIWTSFVPAAVASLHGGATITSGLNCTDLNENQHTNFVCTCMAAFYFCVELSSHPKTCFGWSPTRKHVEMLDPGGRRHTEHAEQKGTAQSNVSSQKIPGVPGNNKFFGRIFLPATLVLGVHPSLPWQCNLCQIHHRKWI